MREYVHGYSDREHLRLSDQAGTLAEILHHDTLFPPGSTVLEAGCGSGAQTVILARRSPEAQILSIDISLDSISEAQAATEREGLGNVRFRQADIYDLPFEEGSFDHVFVCFVLEHLKDPPAALGQLRRVLKKGGSITVIEGDHGSFYCHPQSREASLAVQCLVDLQAGLGGDSLIGRRLYPLLKSVGFERARVSPRMVYVDSSRPELVEGFTKKTFIAMIEGVKAQAISAGLIDEETWDRGVSDLYRTTGDDGAFCYTFFKATGFKGRPAF